MIFTPEVGQKFELISDAFVELMSAAKFTKHTHNQIGIDTLWARVWAAADSNVAN